MIGAGGGAGQGDAANLLKPALARGELRTVAATTWAEYKKYFERDAALARRFQVVKVEEPSEEAATEMMRGLIKTLEDHHHVRILNEAVVDAVQAVQSVHLGTTAARQVRQPAGHHLCSYRFEPDGHATGHRGLPTRIEQLEVSHQNPRNAKNDAGTDHSEQLAERTAEKTAAEAELSHAATTLGARKGVGEPRSSRYGTGWNVRARPRLRVAADESERRRTRTRNLPRKSPPQVTASKWPPSKWPPSQPCHNRPRSRRSPRGTVGRRA